MSHEEEQDSPLVSFLVGVGLGALVAGALAVLFAPKPGGEMRERVADAAGALRQRIESLAERLRAATQQVGAHLKADADEAMSAARQAAAARRAELERKVRGE